MFVEETTGYRLLAISAFVFAGSNFVHWPEEAHWSLWLRPTHAPLERNGPTGKLLLFKHRYLMKYLTILGGFSLTDSPALIEHYFHIGFPNFKFWISSKFTQIRWSSFFDEDTRSGFQHKGISFFQLFGFSVHVGAPVERNELVKIWNKVRISFSRCELWSRLTRFAQLTCCVLEPDLCLGLTWFSSPQSWSFSKAPPPPAHP